MGKEFRTSKTVAGGLPIGQPDAGSEAALLTPIGTAPVRPGSPRLTAESWKSAVSGTWATAADWSGGTVPNASTDATIAVAGTYTVTIGAAAAADSLTLNSASAKVSDTAAFAVTGAITLTAGTFTLGAGGKISAGTLAVGGGSFIASGGTLAGVAFQGALNLTAASSSLYLQGTNSFAGAGGAGAGTINLTGSGASLFAYDSTVLNNATLNFGNAVSSDTLRLASNLNPNDTLTLGAGLNLVQSAVNSQGTIDLYSYTSSGGALINQGTITASAGHGHLTIYGASYGVFTNTGSIAVSNNDTLSLSVNVTTAGLGRFSTGTGGVVRLESGYTLGNGGTTLTLGSAAQLTLAGQITGGTIADSGGGLVAAGGTLSGVTYQGTLSLAAASAVLDVANGLNVTAGGAAGVINVTGSGAVLEFTDSQTLDNATVNLGNGTNAGYLYGIEDTSTAQTLTFGAHLAVVETGKYATINYDAQGYGAVTLLNKGTITASVNGGTLTIAGYYGGNSFINTGSLIASNNAILELATNVTTAGLGAFSTASGGTVLLDSGYVLSNAGSTLNVGSAAQLTLAGSITGGRIVDSGSGIVAAGGTLDGVTYQGTLNLSAANSSLSIYDGLNVTTGGATGIINVTGANATLNIYDSQTLDNATLNLGNSTGYAYLRGYQDTGTAQVLTFGSHLSVAEAGLYGDIYYDWSGSGETLVNNGTISAGIAGGVLYISGQSTGDVFTNTGSLIASNGATIDLQTNITTAGLGSFSTTSQGTVRLDGGQVLNNAGATLTVGSAAQLTLAGLVNGGTIADSGGGLIGAGGTLGGVSYQGTLSLAGANASLTIAGGLNVTTGGGAGIVNVTGSSAYLYLDDTQTLDNATINLGGASGTSFLYEERDVAAAQTLTLGSHLSIVETGMSAIFYYSQSSAPGDALINNGTITAGVSGGSFGIDDYDNTGSFRNNGTLIATNGATLDLQNENVAAGGLGAFSTSGGGTLLFDNGSTLNNAGAVFSVGAANALTLAGVIAGGTIVDAGGGLIADNGTLNGVIYQGTLALSQVFAGITIVNGLNSTGAAGAVINAGGYDTTVYLEDSQTLDNTVINLGSNANYDYLDVVEDNSKSPTVTLGSHMLVAQAGTLSGNAINYDASGIGKAALINNGTILDTVNATSLAVIGQYGGDNFTNNGSLIASNGGTLDLSAAGTIKNIGSGTLTGGYYEADARSTVQMLDPLALTTDAATIVLSGAASVLQFYNATSGKEVTLETNLASIAAAGTLELLAARSFTGAKAFSDAGLLQLGGGTFAETSLAVASTGRLAGFGTVTPAIANSGTVEAKGGLLLVSGAVTGTGALQIDAGATLELHTSSPSTQTVSFNGQAVLKLDAAASFASPIANLLAGDVINIGTLVATAAAISGSSLGITLTGGAMLSETLTAAPGGERVGVSADGHSITAYRYASAATHTPEPVAFGNHHVGDSVSTTLAVTNNAIADGYSEALDASLGGASAGITATGSFTGLGAGMTNASSLKIGLATGSSGAVSAMATIALSTDGAGTDGGAALAIGTQTVNATGAVYAYAAATAANGGIVTLANTHVGQAASGTLTLTNSATANGYAEALDASLSTTLPGFTASGTITGLAAGTTDSADLLVGATGTTGGLYSGTATLGLVSDGNGIDGLGTTALTSQTILITGAAYAYAQATLANGGTVALGNTHVGQAATGTVGISNTAAANGYSEALDASLSGGGAVSTSGTLAGLASGTTDTTHLMVAYTAATGGAYAATATLNAVSDGTGIDGLGTTALASQAVTITGAAYAYAVGQVNGGTVSLGVVHVGSSVAGAVIVTNAAAANGYSEALDAGWSGASSGVITSGTLAGLAAGATSSTALMLGLSTAASGNFAGMATLGLVSDGSGIDGLGTTALTSQTVSITETVDNYAVAAFTDAGGPAITGSGTAYAVNLGRVAQGGAALTLSLGVLNAATGLADLLQGTLTTSGGSGFTNSGFGTFGGLGAGQSETAQGVTLATGAAGTFTETVVLTASGTNASGYIGALPTETLTITGTILSPGTMTTYVLGVGTNNIVGSDGGDVFQAVSGAINSHDNLTGGLGTNVLQLVGGGLFDIGAPATFANIPTITATEGQAAKASAYSTVQTVFMRNGVNEALNVLAGTAAGGNTNPETIAIYDGTGNDSFTLSSGTDQLFLGTGTASVTLGGAANQIVAGGGTATLQGSIANATASIVGTAAGLTTLVLTNAGTLTLNAADSYLTVQLQGASKLTMGAGGFLTAIGSSGIDTLTAGGANQTLTGGLGADSLVGAKSFGDMFRDSSAGLNGDSLTNFGGSDVIDVTDLIFGSLTDSYTGNAAKGTLKLGDGTHSLSITMIGSYTLPVFSFASDGHGGTAITHT